MANLGKIAGLGVGGALLFSGAFVGFARMRGAEMDELPIVGGFFVEKEEPEDVVEQAGPPAHPESVRREPVRAVHAGVFDAFQVPAPYTPSEFAALVNELKGKNRESDELLLAIERKQELLDDRLSSVDEQKRALQEIRTQLETWESELNAREAELRRDEQAQDAQLEARWGELATLFADGEPESLSTRLLEYPAGDAARILRNLEAGQATEILNALPEAQWRDYAEAYSQASK